MPVYRHNGDVYDIPQDKAREFESQFPEATVEMYSGDDVYDIPVSKQTEFLSQFSDARYSVPSAPSAEEIAEEMKPHGAESKQSRKTSLFGPPPAPMKAREEDSLPQYDEAAREQMRQHLEDSGTIERMEEMEREAKKARNKARREAGRYALIAAEGFAPAGTSEAVLNTQSEARQNAVVAETLDKALDKARAGEWGGLGEDNVGNEVADFGLGLWDSATRASTWDFGVSDALNGLTIAQVVKKWEEDPESLTATERNMLDAMGMATAVQEAYQDQVSVGYEVGESLPVSAGFMASMALNPASGMGKSLARQAVKKYGRQSIAKNLARIGGDIAETAIMTATTGGGRVAADALERINGQSTYEIDPETGIVMYGGQEDQKTVGEAVVKAIGSNFIENYSEALGEYFDPLLGMSRRLAAGGLRKMNLDKWADALSDVEPSQMAASIRSLRERAKFGGVFGEIMEEEVGMALNAITVGDYTFSKEEADASKGEKQWIFDLENQLTTAISCAIMSGAITGVETIGNVRYRREMERSVADSEKAARDAVGDEMIAQIDQASPEGMVDILRDAYMDQNLSLQQKRALAEYATQRVRMQYYNAADAKARRQVNVTRQNTIDAYEAGRHAQLPQYYNINQEYRRSEAAINERENAEEIWDAIRLMNNMDENERQNIMRDFSEEEQELIRNWRYNEYRWRGAINHRAEQVEDLVDEYRGQVTPYTRPDGTLTTAILGDDVVYVMNEAENGDAVVYTNDGRKIFCKMRDLEHVQQHNAEELIERFRQQTTQAVNQETDKNLSYPSEVQEPAEGVIVETLDGKQWQVAATDGENVEIVGLIFDKKSGQWIPNSGDYRKMTRGQFLNWQKAELDRKEANTYEQGEELTFYVGGEPISAEITGITPDGDYNVQISHLADGLDKSVSDVYTAEELRKLTTPSSKVSAETTENESTPTEEIKQSVSEEVADSQIEDNVTEPTAEVTESVNTALSRVPKDAKGNPLYEQTDADTAWDAIMEQTEGDAEMAQRIAEEMVADKKAALTKMQKGKPKKGATVAEKIANEKVHIAAIAQAEQEVAAWEEIARTEARRREAAISEAERYAAEMEQKNIKEGLKALGEPQSLQEYVLAQLAGGAYKLRWNDKENGTKGFGSHTGLSTEEMKARLSMVDNKNGLTPEEIAHSIVENMDASFGEVDVMDVTDMVIDAVSTYESRRAMLNGMVESRAELIRQQEVAEQEAKDAWYMEQYGATEEELIAYNELMNEIVSEYAPTEEELQNVYSIFAEQQLEYGNEGTTESISRPTDSREGQGETVDGDNAVGEGDQYAPVETAVYAEGGAAEAVAETDAAVRADADVENKPTANVFEMAEEAQKKRKEKKNVRYIQEEEKGKVEGERGDRPRLGKVSFSEFTELVQRLLEKAYSGVAPTEEVARIIREHNKGKTLLAHNANEQELLKALRVMTNEHIDGLLKEIQETLQSGEITDVEERKAYEDAAALIDRFKKRGERKAIVEALTGANLGEKLPLSKIDELFKMYNSDADVAELYRRVRAIAEQIGLDIWFEEGMGNQLGGYLHMDNRVRLNAHMLYSPYISQQAKASSILHEMLHAVVGYAVKTQKDVKMGLTPAVKLSKQVLNAANTIAKIYEKAVKDNPLLVHEQFNPDTNDMEMVADYGTTSVEEMLVEISNPEFRDKLKQIEYNGRSVWQRIWDAIKSMFTQSSDVTNPTAYDSMAKALDVLINEFSVDAYRKYSGLEESAMKLSAEENLRFRDAQDAAYMDAVERGDMETAQKMVDEAAKKAMRGTKIVDKDKQPMLMSHHTDAEGFYVFDREKIGTGQGQAFLGAGFNFARGTGSSVYGNRNIQAYLYAKKPLRSDRNTLSVYQIEQIIKELNAINGDKIEYNFADNITKAARSIYEYGGDLDTYASLCTAYYGDTKDVMEVFEKLGYDSTIEYDDDKRIRNAVVFNSNQIKSADPVTYDNNGNVIPLSERFNLKDEDIRFRDGAPFFSNAERAVENIKQNKATPEQWLAMIKKDGGLKAGEDKWMGLSDWLNEQKTQGVKTLTKDEMLAFIRENQIEIEEVEYGGNPIGFDELKEEYEAMLHDEGYDTAHDAMIDRFGDDFDIAFEDLGGELAIANEEAASTLLGSENIINSTRLDYTTEGLDNKREIALVVPTIEPWGQTDTIHFGDAGDGRAVAWVRFGETTDEDGNRVLVIDEVQSKRHDEGRAKGYKSEARLKELEREYENIMDEHAALTKEILHDAGYAYKGESEGVYDEDMQVKAEIGLLGSDEQLARRDELSKRLADVSNEHGNLRNAIPDAPFDKNYYEVAMKRMLRYAAENGFDKVAWTKGKQQAMRYDLAKHVSSIEYKPLANGHYNVIAYSSLGYPLDGVPMVYDSEQAIADVFGKDIAQQIAQDVEENRRKAAETEQALSELKEKRKELRRRGVDEDSAEFEETLEEFSRLSNELSETQSAKFIEGTNLSIGGEDRNALYDEMIPRFMNKYAKKWGTKVGEVTLPKVEEAGRTMWSVDVTPEMRESVMQGQPMFREGMGAISDREVSYENDPIAKFQGKPRYYGKRAAAFAERERRRMENAAKEAAEMLGIEAEIITDTSTLQGRKAKAKGWYDISNKKVVVVVPNHVSIGDAVRTVLHEGLAHHGLRELFGDGFDAMLDNIYNNVAPELKARIDAIAERTGVSTQVATEEYLASLAETTNFEEAKNRGWWAKIKNYFVKMLNKLGMPGLNLKEEITDNELRYLLWRSYQNLVDPNSFLKPLGYIDDVAKQKELKVGEYAENTMATPRAAEPSENNTTSKERNGAVAGNSSFEGLKQERSEHLSRQSLSSQVSDAKLAKNTEMAKSKIKKLINEGLRIDNATPNDIVRSLGRAIGMKKSKSSNSFYSDYYEGDYSIEGHSVRVRLSQHPANAERFGASKTEKRISIVVFKDGEHKGNVIAPYSEYTYHIGKLTPNEIASSILNGLNQLLKGEGFDVDESVVEHIDYEAEGDDIRYRTSEEIEAEYPNWMEGTTTDSGKHSTQVEGTRKTYNKVGDWIEENIGKDVAILDASSGMGYGTADLRDRGFNIEDVEPYQSEERKKNNPATYSSYADIDKKYDFIISNAVLNVIPDDWRRDVLHNMAERMNDGGKLFINTRKAGEEKAIKDKIELDTPQEVLVKRNGKIASYQKFFTPQELKEWVESELGDGYIVEVANKKNSGTSGLAAVVVTKKAGGLRYREDSVSLRHISNQKASTIADMISDCFYDDVTQADRIAMVEYLQQSEDGREVIDRLYEHRGSGWARQAVNATMVRIALHDLINGREPSVQSMLTRGAEHKVVSYIRRMGAEGVWRYLEEKDFLSEAAKPLTNVNGSFLSCNPSAECAKYCYATKGHYTYAGSTVKSELVYWTVATDPNRAADRIYREYQALRESAHNKALRLFDKGDLDEAWLPVIDELNRRGIVTQIFSKRSEVLQSVDGSRNVVMLSIDHSNADLLSQYPTMPIAFVYRGKQDMPLLEQCKERFLQYGGVILPVKVGQKVLPKEELDALPSWTRPYQCPIDNGTKQIVNKENPERSWNCTKCDKNGGVGCFFKRTAKQLKDNYNESKRDGLVSRTDRDGERASARNEEGGIGRTSALHDTNGGLGESDIRGGILQTLRDGGIPDAYITPELVEALAGRIRGWNENGTRGRNIGGAESVDAQSSGTRGREDSERDRLKRTSRIDRNSEEIISEVEREAAALGVPVRIVRSVDELPDEDTRKRAVDGKLKGYFDPRTGEVALYEPNTDDANDAKRTVLHEIVGHKGLRQLIGEERYDKAMVQLMYMLPSEVRDAVLRRAERHGWNAAIAMDEYLAEQAERDVQPTWWGKVNAKIRALLRNIGFNVRLTDADVTYLLWRSRKKLMGDTAFDMATNAVLKQAARKSAEADAWNEQAFKDAEMRDFEKGAMQRLRNRISDAQNEYDSAMKSMDFKQRESWQDSMRSLKVFMDIIEKESGKKIADWENAYMYENAMSSANLMEMQMFRHDVYGRLLKAIHELMESGAKYEEVVDYMMAKHGLERNEKMARKRAEKEAEGDAAKEAALYAKYREEDLSGLTALTGVDNVGDAEAAAMQMIADFEAKHNTDLLWNETRACTQTILNISHDAGILSDEVYDELWNQYEYYIPLRGFDETTAEEVYTYVGDNKSPYNAPIKTAKGRKSKADDPIATIATMAESAIVEANRNRLKQRFLYMVERHRTELASVSSVWVEKDPITGDCVARFANIPNDATPEEAAQAQKAFEERMEQLHEQEPERYYKASEKPNIPYRVEKKANEHEHQVIVKRNGKDVVITINGNPRVAQAINGLTNAEAVEGFSKFAGKVNRFLSANFTTRNPAFVVSNFVRDGFYTNSMVWAKEGRAYAWKYNQNWMKATKLLPSLVSKYKRYEKGDKSALDMSDPVDRAFYEFMINGGETGYTVINSVEDYKGIVAGDLKTMQGGVVGNTKKAVQAVGEVLDTFGRWAEDTSRFAAFLTSREMGRSVTKSIWDAKEISVNFNKKGSGRKMTQHDKGLNSILGWMSQQGRNLYVFWNAGMQGLYNFGKAAKEHPGKMAGLAGVYFGLGIAIAAIFGGHDDDEDYWNLPEYVRRNNICFRVGNKFVTLPLPIELRAIYGMGELAMSWMAGKEDPKKVGMKVVQQMSQVMPIDMMADGGGLMAFVPSWGKPIVEVGVNTDWTGMPIYRERTPWNEYDPQWMLAFKSTSPELVAASRVINEATNKNLPSGKENKYDRGWADIEYLNNPAAWEHIAEGYLGGLATMFNQTKKSVMAIWNEDLREVRNIPVVSRFVKDAGEKSEEYALREDYFNAKGVVDELRSQRGHFRKESIDPSLTEEQRKDVVESRVEMEKMVNATISQWNNLENARKKLEDMVKDNPDQEVTFDGKKGNAKDALDEVTRRMVKLTEGYQ